MMIAIARKANKSQYISFLDVKYTPMICGGLESFGNDLGQLLARRRGAGCKDPRDFIHLDYGKPIPLVFAETTARIIRVHGNLGVLSEIYDTSIKVPELPTWVPNWQIKKDYDVRFSNSTTAQGRPLYCASGTSKPSALVAADAKQLTLQGIVLDTVAFKSPKPMVAGGWTWVEQNFSDDKFPGGMYAFTDEPIEDALMRTIYADEINEGTRSSVKSIAELRDSFRP